MVNYYMLYNLCIRELLQKNDSTWYKTGDEIVNKKLAETLMIIQRNAEDFYNGSLAQEIVRDVNTAGGNFSKEDLLNYKVKERSPFVTTIKGMKMYTMPPPGSGAVVGMTMNILEGKKNDFFSTLCAILSCIYYGYVLPRAISRSSI